MPLNLHYWLGDMQLKTFREPQLLFRLYNAPYITECAGCPFLNQWVPSVEQALVLALESGIGILS